MNSATATVGNDSLPLEGSALLLFGAVLAAAVGYAALGSFAYGAPGTLDFIEYWTAYRVGMEGGDPYSATALAELQREVGRQGRVLMYWGPPWLLALQAPLLELPFESAARAWLLVNVICLLLTATMAVRLYSPGQSSMGLLAGLISVPALHCLYVGQVSLVLALGVALLLFGLERDRVVVGGLGAALLTIKPHLFLLLGLFVLWRAVRFGSFRLLLSGLGWLGLMVLVSLWLLPAGFEGWLGTLQADPSVPVSRFGWRTATLVSVVRERLASRAGGLPLWPLVVIPTAAGLVFLLMLARRRWSERFVNSAVAHFALSASLVFAPFGWFFDSSVLVPTQVALAGRDVSGQASQPGVRTLLLVGLAATQVAGVVALLMADYHHELFWFPTLILVLWIVKVKTSPGSQGA